jgi:hypothetical protein
MLYRLEAGKIWMHAVEFAAVDHCNLRCSGCSHMSPFLESTFHSEDEFERDFGRLATVAQADEVRIVGGEALLNPRIVPILKAAKASGIARRVVLATNGLLLHTMPDEFWSNVDEVRLSLYPGARPTERLVEQAKQRAAESGTHLHIWEYANFRVTMVTEPHPADLVTDMIFRTCKNAHLYHCHLVREGWIYKCACPSYLSEYLGRLHQSGYEAERDGFDIHGAADLQGGLWSFLVNRRALDACRYCLGYVGHEQKHHQLTIDQTKDVASVPIARRTHLNRQVFVKESVSYVKRRTTEFLTGKATW